MRVRFARHTLVPLGVIALMVACGTNKPGPSTASSTKSGDPATPADKSGEGDGGASAHSDEKPFAGSAQEATALISAVVDKKQDEIATCVREFRTRKNLAHEKVSISFGIDQDGRLLGVTSKGKEDAALKACVQDVLKGGRFPRSHAGVITVTKTYEEIIK